MSINIYRGHALNNVFLKIRVETNVQVCFDDVMVYNTFCKYVCFFLSFSVFDVFLSACFFFFRFVSVLIVVDTSAWWCVSQPEQNKKE